MIVSQSRICSSWTDQRSYHGRMRWRCWSDFFKMIGLCKMRWYIDSEMNVMLLSVNQQSRVLSAKIDDQERSCKEFLSIIARNSDNNIVMRWVSLLQMILSFWMNLSSMKRLTDDIKLMLQLMNKLDIMLMFEEM